MYLQISVQYHSDDFVGQDEEGNLFKRIVVFMIVSLKNFVPIVIRSLPETKIISEWLKWEINKSILDLAEVGFKAWAVITNDHPSNVNTFTGQHEIFGGDNKTFIKHPVYTDFATKSYLFFDVIHLFKNIKKNLLNQKKFVLPSFQFDQFHDSLNCNSNLFHSIYLMRCMKETKIFRLI